jgi:hypothetical protein
VTDDLIEPLEADFGVGQVRRESFERLAELLIPEVGLFGIVSHRVASLSIGLWARRTA